jgi:hypothetical protein
MFEYKWVLIKTITDLFIYINEHNIFLTEFIIILSLKILNVY